MIFNDNLLLRFPTNPMFLSINHLLQYSFSRVTLEKKQMIFQQYICYITFIVCELFCNILLLKLLKKQVIYST